jgi:hypothetical protein
LIFFDGQSWSPPDALRQLPPPQHGRKLDVVLEISGGRVLEESVRAGVARAPRRLRRRLPTRNKVPTGRLMREDLPVADAPRAPEEPRARRMMGKLLLDPSA